ncbi:MAG: hypothetical protein J1D87_07550 [Lachnospiraceae bacterium]|nr:hypothetical protein [Lachnospiraceae bacterium]
MYKKTIQQIMSVLVTICLLVGCLYYIQQLTRVKTALTRDMSYSAYFKYAKDYDILYFGTSHVMYGINPLEIWNEYGLTSYNWGSPTCTLPKIYWKLMNVLDYESPQLVVVDCYRTTWLHKTYNKYRMHEAFDAFPLSYTKWTAIDDLMKDEIRMEDGLFYTDLERYSILFPVCDYHSRWGELQKIDFVNEFVDTKGCEFEIDVDEPIEISNTSEKAEITENMQGVIYLERIIEECQNRNIPLLLTYLPFPTDETCKKESNVIQDIADKYGVNYVNFTNLDVVNYQIDYSDSASHMNIAGQKKVSEYLGEYICENYEIEDRRDSAIADRWNAWYKEYKEYEAGFINSQNDLDTYLMLLYDSSNDIIIDLKENALTSNNVYKDLLSGVGSGTDKINDTTDFIIVHAGKTIALDNFRENGVTKETEIGTVSLRYGDSEYSIYIDGDEYYTESINDSASIRIKATKNDNLLDDVRFKYTVDPENTSVSIVNVSR